MCALLGAHERIDVSKAFDIVQPLLWVVVMLFIILKASWVMWLGLQTNKIRIKQGNDGISVK